MYTCMCGVLNLNYNNKKKKRLRGNLEVKVRKCGA